MPDRRTETVGWTHARQTSSRTYWLLLARLPIVSVETRCCVRVCFVTVEFLLVSPVVGRTVVTEQ